MEMNATVPELKAKKLQNLVKKYNLHFKSNPTFAFRKMWFSIEGDVEDFNKFEIAYDNLVREE